MRKLIVCALFVSVFFIGITSLITDVGARFRSDDKAMELIRASRIALGGSENLTAVRSMTIKAATTHFFEKNGVQDVKQGSMEINFEIPNKFSKRVMIGTPGEGDPDAVIEKDVDVIVHDGAGTGEGDKQNVFIIRKGDGKNIEWNSEGGGNVRSGDGKVVIKEDDGTVEEINTDGIHKMIVRENSDGKVETIDRTGPEENVWVNKDGKQMRIERDEIAGPHKGSNEMLRTTIALLMTAPDDGSVTYKFAGQGNVDGYPSNIIEVGSNGSTFKLYLDAGTNLPQMISYEGHGPKRIIVKKEGGGAQENVYGSEGERQVKFSDFRSVGSLLLPHRWTEISNGKATQNIDITGYEINPSDIASKFSGSEGGQRVIIRKQKN